MAVYIGSPARDTILGSQGDDIISGLAGNDSLSGAAGNDSLDGGGGIDSLYGGTGDDTLDLIFDGKSGSHPAWADGGDGADLLFADFHAFTSLQGGVNNTAFEDGWVYPNGGDYIAADGKTYLRTAGIERVSLLGTDYADYLFGTSGNDTLAGGGGADTLSLREGDDLGLGGDGDDFINDGSTWLLGFPPPVTGRDTMYGGNGDDTIRGDQPGDFLDGGAGDDVLQGGDTIFGGEGNDSIRIYAVENTIVCADGGDGTDSGLIYFGNVAETVGITNADGNFWTRDGTLLAIISGFESDSIVGSYGDDQLFGGDGNDYVEGHGGNDSLWGEAGNDSLVAGSMGKYVNGGSGIDTLYAGISSIPASPVSNAYGDFVTAGGTLLIAVRNVEVLSIEQSANRADSLFGGSLGDSIVAGGSALVNGRAGDDTLSGGTVWGGEGNDSLLGVSSSSVIRGGDGNDILNTLIATASRAYGEAGNDTLNIWNGYASGGDGDDLLIAQDMTGARLYGNGGNDTLQTYAGLANGGDGDDLYEVTGAATVNEAENGGRDTVVSDSFTLGANLEDLVVSGNGSGNDLANVIFGSQGANRLFGGGRSDTLYGGVGNDYLDGGTDNDRMYGGTGADVYVVNSTRDYTIENDGEGYDSVIASLNWTLDANIENLQLTGAKAKIGRGNRLNNRLVGSDISNALDGATGNDTLTGTTQEHYGLHEIDTLTGGSGHDVFVLGVKSTIFYADHKAATEGTGDYALITDFQSSTDRLQLQGKASQYYLGASDVPGVSGKGLYHEDGATDELIAILQSAGGSELTDANVIAQARFV